jgi:hypothetical protein
MKKLVRILFWVALLPARLFWLVMAGGIYALLIAFCWSQNKDFALEQKMMSATWDFFLTNKNFMEAV